MLSLDRRIDAEVLDARGGVSVHSGRMVLSGVLRDVPQLFVEGAQLAVTLNVGDDAFEAV
jgi:hypothetical protein